MVWCQNIGDLLREYVSRVPEISLALFVKTLADKSRFFEIVSGLLITFY